MIRPEWSLAATSIAVTIAVSLGVDFVAAEFLGIGPAHARWWLLLATLSLLGATLAFRLGSEWTSRKDAAQDLEMLGRSDTHRLAQTSPYLHEPRRDVNVWQKAVDRLNDKMRSMARQIDELQRERAAYEQRAKGFEARLRQVHSVLAALAEPVLVIDKRDRLVLTNPSANRLLDIPKTDVDDRALASLVRCEQLVELLTDTRRQSAFVQQSREIEIADRSGITHWFRVTARNIPTQPGDSDPDGTSQGAVALMHDISAQRSLQRRNSEFVTAVSHEMKTPLASIKAYVELLADGDAESPQAQEQFLQVISAQSDRLQYLIDNLVDLARIEADLAGNQRNLVGLAPVIAEAVNGVARLAEDKNLRLDVAAADPPHTVLGDRLLLVQAVSHLLSNAVKYTPSGGNIQVRYRTEKREVVMEVEDSGVGLSEQDRERVFEKFYRAPSSKELAEGAGLGLALVKHIVEDVHGGRVSVESELGKGSRFTITLPAAPMES
jgi:two-component system phosphate regulon sensor histidine kinase PhoR